MVSMTLPQAMGKGKAAEPPSDSGEKSGSAFTFAGARNLIETVLLESDRRRVRQMGIPDVGAASCVCLMSVSVLLAAFVIYRLY